MEKLDGREFKGVRVTCVADVRFTGLDSSSLLMFYRPSRTFPATGLDLDPQLVDPTRMTMTAVAHPEDIAPAAMVTATEAHRAVATMMMTVADIVHPQELVAPLMIILLLVDGSMILTAAITLLTHMSMAMADLLQETTLPGITHQENAVAMPMTTLLLVIGNQSF